MEGEFYRKPAEILLVEDNPGDVRLTQEALREGQVANHLNVVLDGEEALDFLMHAGKYNNAPRPDLILLDLNLPKLDGRELLGKIKSDQKTKSIPVVVLTTSQAEQDILRSYNLYANCFITKPVNLDQFLNIVRSIENFWLKIAKLPPETDLG